MIACETLTTKDSSQEGWVQWGHVNDAGSWDGLYGLKASLNREESMYYLDAAGVCEAVGTSGLPIIDDSPVPVVEALPEEIKATSLEASNASANVARPEQSDQFPWGVIAVAGFCIALLGYKRLKKHGAIAKGIGGQTEGQKYPSIFGGDDDAV